MEKKDFKKATMKVVEVECERHLLSASGGDGGLVIMSGSSENWSEIE